MLALKVSLNGEEVSLAGANDWMELMAFVSAERQPFPDASAEGAIQLIIKGTTKPDASGNAHDVRWPVRNLAVGAVVTVEVVEVDAANEPAERHPLDAETGLFLFDVEEWEKLERQELSRLKAKYEPDNTN